MSKDYVLKFGKHKGISVEEVSASYLLWLNDQPFAPAEVSAYVAKNKKFLLQEVEEGEDKFIEQKDFLKKMDDL